MTHLETLERQEEIIPKIIKFGAKNQWNSNKQQLKYNNTKNQWNEDIKAIT